MPLKIKFIKDDDEGILPYCEEEDAEKFYFQQILTARFSWGAILTIKNPKTEIHSFSGVVFLNDFFRMRSSLKNSESIAEHSSSITPPVTSGR